MNELLASVKKNELLEEKVRNLKSEFKIRFKKKLQKAKNEHIQIDANLTDSESDFEKWLINVKLKNDLNEVLFY